MWEDAVVVLAVVIVAVVVLAVVVIAVVVVGDRVPSGCCRGRYSLCRRRIGHAMRSAVLFH